MDTPEEQEPTPQTRADIRDTILRMPLPTYCKEMCGLELSASQEAMLLSWCRLQLNAMQHNVAVAHATGYARASQRRAHMRLA